MNAVNLTKNLMTISMAVVLMIGFTLNSQANPLVVKKSNTNNPTMLTVKEQLASAQKAGNAVFLVITSTNATGVKELVAVATQANKKVKKSTVIQMNRDDAANKDLVTKFGVASVAVPFVLVISPKGIAVGGYPAAQATAYNLVMLIPSAKYDEVLAAINVKKPVFIVASKKSFTDKTSVLAVAKTAAAKVSNTPVIVEVDMSSASEAAFLKQIGVNTLSTSTVTVVVNASGSITGNFTGAQSAQTLADAASKVIKSCCPAGSSSGCGPKK